MSAVPPPFESTPLPPPAPPAPPAPPSSPVPTYLAWSITVTVLCFFSCCILCYSLPGIATGVVAIVFASRVNGLLDRGDAIGARRASDTARIWCWVTTAILVLSVVVFFVSLWMMGGVEGYMMQIEELQRQIEAAE